MDALPSSPAPKSIPQRSRRGRAHEAHALRISGLDWSQVAAATGYKNGNVAAMAVTAYLRKTAVEQAPGVRQAALELEVARLDALQVPYWKAAIDGDLSAATYMLKLIDRRISLLGLERLHDVSSTPQTLIISGTSEEYIGGLQKVLADTEARRVAQGCGAPR